MHDAEVQAIRVDHGSVTLQLRDEDGTPLVVSLRGVRDFRCDHLGPQNIISRTRQSADDEFSAAEIEEWLRWVTSDDGGSWLPAEKLADWTASCLDKRLNLLVMTPSVGALIAAVCEACVITDEAGVVLTDIQRCSHD
jgi:hypothetical protein